MATVCGGCLSLMDAACRSTPRSPASPWGLIKEDDKIAILSDILGDEDHLGDMDFKVCGTARGSPRSRWTSRSPASTSRSSPTRCHRPAKGRRAHSSARWPRLWPRRRRHLQVRTEDHHHPHPGQPHQGRHRTRRQGDQGHHRPHRRDHRHPGRRPGGHRLGVRARAWSRRSR